MVGSGVVTSRPTSRYRGHLLLQLSNLHTALVPNSGNFLQVGVLHDAVGLSKEVINQQSQLLSVAAAGLLSVFVNARVDLGRHGIVSEVGSILVSEGVV